MESYSKHINDMGAIVLFVIIFAIAAYLQGTHFYNFYVRTYHKEIFDYLERYGLQPVDIRQPNNLDWRTSSFKKPSSITFFQRIIFKQHRVIEAQTAETDFLIWLEITTGYFQSEELTFRVVEENERQQIEHNENVGYEQCPACHASLPTNNTICPACGLHLK